MHGFFSNEEQDRGFVVTTGMFDGVHAGHRHLIRDLNNIAHKQDLRSMIVTFHPHPQMVLRPDEKMELISTFDEKINLLRLSGVDEIVVLPFTPELAMLTAEEFVEQYLVGQYGMCQFVVGYNHNFGSDRKSNIDDIRKYGEKYNFSVIQAQGHIIDDVPVSSSKIRKFLKLGDLVNSKKMLGYGYRLIGRVGVGRQIGRTIGFPTANLIPVDPNKLVPGNGVYAALVKLDYKSYAGMVNIGFRPTIDDAPLSPTIEVHIVGFQGDLYNRIVEVEFVAKVRDEIKFPNLDALRQQIAEDKHTILGLLRR